jgi:hypothetical protein
VVGAAGVDRLLCIGHCTGQLKVWVLPGVGGSASGSVADGESWSPRAGAARGEAVVVAGVQPVPARMQAHRSGMVLLRAVDGGGHTGVATAGRFGRGLHSSTCRLNQGLTLVHL